MPAWMPWRSGFILYASGGVASGLVIVLVLPVLVLTLLAERRDALLIAALAALAVLVSAIVRRGAGRRHP